MRTTTWFILLVLALGACTLTGETIVRVPIPRHDAHGVDGRVDDDGGGSLDADVEAGPDARDAGPDARDAGADVARDGGPDARDVGADVVRDGGPDAPLCPTGFTACPSGCADLQSDVTNCGSCGTLCGSAGGTMPACVRGRCEGVCPAGTHPCAGRCVRDDDPSACGAACLVCPNPPNATALCSGGSCTFRCNAGFADCDRAPDTGCEVDVRVNPMHCGACGTVCFPGSFCSGGLCGTTCPAPATTVCGGTCVDTRTSESHCGGCGRRCPLDSNVQCCGGTCVDLRASDQHCGACGSACPMGTQCGPALMSPTVACEARPNICGPGQMACGGACVTVNTIEHCGACGVRCPVGFRCDAGRCVGG